MRFAIAVRRGAKLLDGAKPGWWKEIEPKTLAMEACNACILGQAYEEEARREGRDRFGYSLGKERLGLNEGDRTPAAYGFCAINGRDRELRTAWLGLIKSRYIAEAKRMK